MLNPGPIFLVITKGGWGGAGRYVFDLLTNLPNDSRERVLVTGTTGELTDKVNKADLKVKLVSGLGRDISPAQDFLVFWRLYKLFKTGGPSVVHLNSSKIGGLGALAARLAGVPKIIYTVHGWPFMEPRFILARVIIWFLAYLSVILAHQTIVLGEQEKKRANWMLGVKNKITVIPLGISLENILPRDTARKELGLGENEIVIASIGELHQNKGYDLLLEVMSELVKIKPDLKLALIGEGEEGSNLTTQIAKLNLDSNIKLLGRKDNASQYLLAFDVFVLPSRKEGLPYVLLEAGLVGVPIIATSVGSIPDLITNDIDGKLVEPNNIKNLTEEITTTLSDLTTAKNMATTLQNKIKHNYALNQMTKKTFRLY